MPRVHTKVARNDIYARGLDVEDKSTKRGTRKNRSLPADENDYVIVKKGQTYYSWTFRYGGTIRSTKRPRQSQLTQSNFLSQAYGIQEQIEDYTPETHEDLESFIEQIIDECQQLADECQESRDNMPESLQDAPTGELLGERVEAMESFISELESIQVDIDCDLEDFVEELQGLCMECC